MNALIGIVEKRIDEKTISFVFKTKEKNTFRLNKFIVRKVLVHDDKGIAYPGNTAIIKKCAPKSKMKFYALESILKY